MLSKFGGDESCKRHQRLDSFLQRYLDRNAYEKICAVEPCVVCCGKYNRVFKFVVVSCSTLYILENPPRKSKDVLLKVNLKNILNVKLINDIPEFFTNSDVKDQVQHIFISTGPNAITVPGLPVNSKTSLSGSKSSSRSAIDLSQSTSSNRLLLAPDRSGYDLLSSASSSGGQSFKSFQVPLEFRSHKTYRKLPSPPPGSKNNNANFVMESVRHSSSFSNATEISSRRRKVSLLGACCSEDAVKTKNDVWSSDSNDPLLREQASSQQLGHSNTSLNFRGLNGTASTYDASFSFSRSLDVSQSSKHSLGSKSYLGESLSSSRSHIQLLPDHAFDAKSMDIYLLSKESNFFYHLQAAWTHCLLEPLPMGLLAKKSTEISKLPLIRAKFLELQAEILENPPIDMLCVATKELYSSLKTIFEVKKLFWKEQNLFQHYALLANKLWDKTNNFSHGHESELDCLIFICQVMTAAIQETGVLSCRNKALHSNRLDVFHIIQALSRWPRMFQAERSQRLSTAAAQLLNGTISSSKLLYNKDMENFEQDWVQASTELLYELLIASKQGRLLQNIDSKFTPSLIAKQLAKNLQNQTVLSSWFKHLIDCLKSYVNDETGPSCVYKLLTSILMLMESNDFIKQQICKNFTEEFRYYILSPMTIKKISNGHLSNLTIPVLQRIAKHMTLSHLMTTQVTP